ncbi:MAG: UDP-N-acetylmuramate--L-alanine ligase [Candidatus Eremiobacteraeota bacterium]|nr:UDP-N-acetylmuramate--L-alanine ligase [Candidatus Eremiobacteraeota bacterium]
MSQSVRRHFIGIGGIGMSALARILLARGESVAGSDLAESELLEQLRAEGARVYVGHDADSLGDAEEVIVSSAIDRDNPEFREARRRKLPVVHRGELLARIASLRDGIAICGTHGKTTTTAMLHAILRAGGIDAGLVLGGIDPQLGRNAVDGTSPWFVCEADESDGSFALLQPRIAAINNIENDHLNSDDELPRLIDAFGEFLGRLPAEGAAIVGIDNANSASLAARERAARTITFGMTALADVTAANVVFSGLSTHFDLVVRGERRGALTLNVPGAINVLNALAAIAVACEVGAPFAAIAAGLRDFCGVRRRFDILARGQRLTVVDDYAHHPTAVRATIAAARNYHSGPLVVAFQPHRYSRTGYLARDFADALRGADRVYLTPIYAASEAPIPGISERSIGDRLSEFGVDVRYVARVEELVERIEEESPPGTLALMLGAGSITRSAARLAERAMPTAALR